VHVWNVVLLHRCIRRGCTVLARPHICSLYRPLSRVCTQPIRPSTCLTTRYDYLCVELNCVPHAHPGPALARRRWIHEYNPVMVGVYAYCLFIWRTNRHSNVSPNLFPSWEQQQYLLWNSIARWIRVSADSNYFSFYSVYYFLLTIHYITKE
jgi:hypothetical protein